MLAVGDSKRTGAGSGRRSRSRGAKQQISELDAYRSAELIIEQHGEEAAILASRRVDFFLGEGDTWAAAVWRKILAAIEELQRRRRQNEALN